MAERKACQVSGCGAKAHARGYCRRHYGQIWRKGKVREQKRIGMSDDASRDDLERLRALEREFRRAQQMYSVVIGYEGRLKWRREMESVKVEILRIDRAYFKNAAAATQNAEL